MTGRTSHACGFTLLEVLAATAITAVLAGSLYTSLHVAFKARDSALASVEWVRKIDLAMELIKDDLQSAVVPNGVSAGALAGAFVGSANVDLLAFSGDTLSFFAAPADVEPGPGVGDIRQIEYSCQSSLDSNDLVLVRGVTANLLASITPEPKEEIVCRGVRGFILRYFDGSTWQNNWDSVAQNNTLPKAVEVTIELNDLTGTGVSRMSRIVMIPCSPASSASTSTLSEVTK